MKTGVDFAKKSIGMVVDPLLKISSEFGDAVYDLTIGREAKEALYQSERKFWYEVDRQYEESFTDGQKEVMSLGLDALEVVGAGRIVKQLAKVAIKQAKPHVDITPPKMDNGGHKIGNGDAPGGKPHTSAPHQNGGVSSRAGADSSTVTKLHGEANNANPQVGNQVLRFDEKINNIIDETVNSKVNSFTSAYRVTENEALELGLKWLGDGYKPIGKAGDGVFRSADGTKQFRMDSNSLLGSHNPHEPHVHLEMVAPDGRTMLNKNHIEIIND